MRTESEIRKRLAYLRRNDIHKTQPTDNDYKELVAEIITLEWVLKEGGVEVENEE